MSKDIPGCYYDPKLNTYFKLKSIDQQLGFIIVPEKDNTESPETIKQDQILSTIFSYGMPRQAKDTDNKRQLFALSHQFSQPPSMLVINNTIDSSILFPALS